VLFEKSLRDGIADGSISLAFRRWKRPQVVGGRRYRTGEGLVGVDAVDVVEEDSVTEAEAREAGYRSRADLLQGLGAAPGTSVYRLSLHRVDEPDPRDELAADHELTDGAAAELTRRLDRLDGASARGPWTRTVLGLIAAHPGRRAGDLAASLGRDVPPFKRDVRKLKELGLTLSLEVGYRLSPRGEAYLERVAGPAPSS
jgi:hypothetical protein